MCTISKSTFRYFGNALDLKLAIVIMPGCVMARGQFRTGFGDHQNH